jgi:WD40 repeat protein
VVVYEFPAMREEAALEFETLVGSATFSPDGKRLAVVRNRDPKLFGKGEVILLDPFAPEERVVLPTKTGLPAVAFPPDGKDILVGDYDLKNDQGGDIKVYDARSGEKKGTVGGRMLPGLPLAVTNAGSLMIVERGIMHFYDYRNDKYPPLVATCRMLRLGAQYGWIQWASVAPDESCILATTNKGKRAKKSKVLLEDVKRGELTEVFKDPSSEVMFITCALSPEPRTFAVGTDMYWGVRGKRGDPFMGRVLLFRREK